MNTESGLFRATTAFVKIAYAMALTAGVLLPIIAILAALFPAFPWASGTHGLQIDAVGLKIDLTSSVIADNWRVGFVLSFGAGAVSAWALLYVFIQLRALLANAAGGLPFSADNVRRITRIGLAIIAASLIEAVGRYALGRYVYASVRLAGATLRPVFQFPFGTVLLGLIVLCLAETFRYGVKLQDDQDLTV